MMIPGSNLLKMASRLISLQNIQYLKFLSRSTNSVGLLVPVYASPCWIKGSVQPVPRVLMETLGLDFQKHYVNIFVAQSVIDIRRDVSSDKFTFNGTIYQGISLTKWHQIDGWNACLCVEVPT